MFSNTKSRLTYFNQCISSVSFYSKYEPAGHHRTTKPKPTSIIIVYYLFHALYFTGCRTRECICYWYHLSYSYVLYAVQLFMGYCCSSKYNKMCHPITWCAQGFFQVWAKEKKKIVCLSSATFSGRGRSGRFFLSFF